MSTFYIAKRKTYVNSTTDIHCSTCASYHNKPEAAARCVGVSEARRKEHQIVAVEFVRGFVTNVCRVQHIDYYLPMLEQKAAKRRARQTLRKNHNKKLERMDNALAAVMGTAAIVALVLLT